MQFGPPEMADLVHELTEIGVTFSDHDPAARPPFVLIPGNGYEDRSSACPFLFMLSTSQNRPTYARAPHGAQIFVCLG